MRDPDDSPGFRLRCRADNDHLIVTSPHHAELCGRDSLDLLGGRYRGQLQFQCPLLLLNLGEAYGLRFDQSGEDLDPC